MNWSHDTWRHMKLLVKSYPSILQSQMSGVRKSFHVPATHLHLRNIPQTFSVYKSDTLAFMEEVDYCLTFEELLNPVYQLIYL